jgi:hypothetical protein
VQRINSYLPLEFPKGSAERLNEYLEETGLFEIWK